MHVSILTLGLTVLKLGVSGSPLPRISGEKNTVLTVRDALPQVETIATPNDFKEAPMVRRRDIINGDGGFGIGVSAGSGVGDLLLNPKPLDPLPPSKPPSNPITPPLTPPVTQPVTPPVTIPVQPPITTSPEPDPISPLPPVVPFQPNPADPVDLSIKKITCWNWFHGTGSTVRPLYCDTSSPGVIGN
ncbi:hypothetical protein MMC07_001945 [Pseudocyphellaria aurata]|nr:hypothetical protein [Pseudocyphellaria aurata]